MPLPPRLPKNFGWLALESNYIQGRSRRLFARARSPIMPGNPQPGRISELGSGVGLTPNLVTRRRLTALATLAML
jgi:hypothetical protein